MLPALLRNVGGLPSQNGELLNLSFYVYYILTDQPKAYFSPWKKQAEKCKDYILHYNKNSLHCLAAQSHSDYTLYMLFPSVCVNYEETTK